MLALLWWAAACGDGSGGPAATTTGGGTTTPTGGGTGTGQACTAAYAGSTPSDGEVDWYVRDPIEVWFDGDAEGAVFDLFTLGGEILDLEVAWVDSGHTAATLTVPGGLPPAEDLALTVFVCGVGTTLTFSTSEWGLPIEDGPESLVGRTYAIDPATVNYTKPENLGALLQLYLDLPLLIGVEAADDTTITLLGALGQLDPIEGYSQIPDEPTWNFDEVDFSDHPFLLTTAASITLAYNGVDIPIHDFWMEGVFAADGSAIGEGSIGGLVDTRNISILFKSPDEPGLVCDTIAKPLGVECVPCPDGEPYCMDARADDVLAEEVEGLTLVRVE